MRSGTYFASHYYNRNRLKKLFEHLTYIDNCVRMKAFVSYNVCPIEQLFVKSVELIEFALDDVSFINKMKSILMHI